VDRGLGAARGRDALLPGEHRNAASFCTIATFNITNSLRAVWLL